MIAESISCLKARAPAPAHDIAHGSSSPLYFSLSKRPKSWHKPRILDHVGYQLRRIAAYAEEFQS
jgi:hypothetical protein